MGNSGQGGVQHAEPQSPAIDEDGGKRRGPGFPTIYR